MHNINQYPDPLPYCYAITLDAHSYALPIVKVYFVYLGENIFTYSVMFYI